MKRISFIVASLVLMSIAFAVNVNAAYIVDSGYCGYIFNFVALDSIADVKVTLNGTALSFDQPPIIVNNRTLVPLRAIFEAMGAAVDWDQETQTVTSSKGSTNISLTIGGNTIIYGVKNGKWYEPKVSGKYSAFRKQDGLTLGTVSDFSKGYHDYIDYEFSYNAESGEFAKGNMQEKNRG